MTKRPEVSLHEIAPRLAKARDQRVRELRMERYQARMRDVRESIVALGRAGVSAGEAMQRMGAAWAKAYPARLRVDASGRIVPRRHW